MARPRTPSLQPAFIRVSTGSRLHLGLFDVKAPFGGIGLMIDQPRTIVGVEPADAFEVAPCAVDRITGIAARVARRLPVSMTRSGLPKCRVTIEAAADAHCGLGSGTQLALSAATAISAWFSLSLSRQELVRDIAARGRRSSIGSIGFFEGGLIAEDGERVSYESPSSSWSRTELPEPWRVVLAIPSLTTTGVSGKAEGAAFAALAPATCAHRRELARLSQQILGACDANDFNVFSEAVATFNVRSGELFAAQQGGCFHGPEVEALASRIASLGTVGVGQSSWGPTVFAFCESDDAARRLCSTLGNVQCRIVKPQSSGYKLLRSPNTSCS